MKRHLSAKLALLGLLAGLFFGSAAPLVASAQGASILPGATDGEINTSVTDCVSLRVALENSPKEMEGKNLALKLRCGRLMLGDLPHYFKHAISFVLNTIGTLAVIAVIRAGYIFMLSKDKELTEGRKAIVQVIIGLVIAALSFTAAQIVLRVLFSVQNISPV